MRGRRSAALVVAAIAVLTSSSFAAPQRMAGAFTDALTLYDLGEHDTVIDGFARAINRDPANVVKFLDTDAEAWIAADGKDAIPRRRLVATTFALELGKAGVNTQWSWTRDMLEWACTQMRKAGPPTEEELDWDLASLALIEGSFEPPNPRRPESSWLPTHINHIRERFPKEPRLLLARALIDEFEYWILRWGRGPNGPLLDDSAAAAAIPALEKAAAVPANAKEARLRIGYLQMRLGKLDSALEHLQFAAEGDDDPTRVHLAHLFIGWTHERAGRFDEATAAFRQSIAVINGQSAALALGTRLYAADARDEADDIVMAAVSGDRVVADPWKVYGYGDYRRFPQLIARLRARILPR
ncbi:MAG TPA: hypothetical protein VFV98_08405 [Vicinamibacterales bacterium]|nr:hypothetical protein [Vicinamibacterales bacterium]